MKTDRLTRINALLRREIGETLFRVMDGSAFDLAAVTVTHVQITSDLRAARVLVSIRNHETERSRMLRKLQSRHTEIQAHLAEKVVLKYTPHLTFALDASVEAGDRVLDLLDKIVPAAEASPSPASDDTPPTEAS